MSLNKVTQLRMKIKRNMHARTQKRTQQTTTKQQQQQQLETALGLSEIRFKHALDLFSLF